jgi:tetratricopeptide (TPR) repeat protein
MIRQMVAGIVVLTFAMLAFAQTREDSLKTAEVYFQRGVGEYMPGNLEAALYDPESAKAWHGRGATLARLNQHFDAQLAFDEAIRREPDYQMAWWHRGCDNSVSGRLDTALSDLAHVLALDSTAGWWPFEDPCWNPLLDDPRLLKMTAPYSKEHRR